MSTPTIYKYLLDIFTAARLKTANDGGDQKAIARAHAAYDGLVESDVVFGPITRIESLGRYKTSITCKKRNWAATSVTFPTGTLKALCGYNIQGVAQLKSLSMADRPGLFYINETDTLYMMTEKDANIFEALKMSGWEIPATSINTVIYPTRKDDIRAVGHVDIDHPIVTGRFMLDYLVHAQQSQPQSEEELTEENTKPDTSVKSEEVVSTENQQSATADSSEGASTQAVTESQTPAESEAPATSDTNEAGETQEPAKEATEENTQPSTDKSKSKK